MTSPGSEAPEFDFVQFLRQVVPSLPDYQGMSVSIADEQTGPADLLVWADGAATIVEAKVNTPKTRERLQAVVGQLRQYATIWSEEASHSSQPRLVLAVPGTLPDEHQDMLRALGVSVWDGSTLASAAAVKGISVPKGVRLTPRLSLTKPPAMVLRRTLARTPVGRSHWPQYQRFCTELLAYLFCPPLEAPLTESANATHVNRRDIILPNYAEDNVWAFLRSHYRADHIVVDAKNTQRVTKAHILQLSNYLSYHGAGLLGIILTRRGSDFASEVTRREQWVLHNKIIIVLNDDNVRTMIDSKESGEDPAIVLRQLVEDFRLGM